jgi:hypothetical protein
VPHWFNVLVGSLALMIGASAPPLIIESLKPGCLWCEPALDQTRHQKDLQNPKTEEHGTEQVPLVVKIIPPNPTPKQEQREEEKAEQDRRLADYTELLFFATSFLGLATAGLAGVAYWQMREGRKAIGAAIISAKATRRLARETRRQANAADRHLTTLERPYLFFSAIQAGIQAQMGADQLVYKPMQDPMNFRLLIRYEISNYGRTPAVIRDMLFAVISIPPPLPPTPDYVAPSIAKIIMAEMPIAPQGEPIKGDVPFADVPLDSNSKLFIFGKIRYADTIGNRFVMGFGVRKLEHLRPAVHVYGGKAYNYQRDDTAPENELLRPDAESLIQAF